MSTKQVSAYGASPWVQAWFYLVAGQGPASSGRLVWSKKPNSDWPSLMPPPKEEYRNLLLKYHVEFNGRYVWQEKEWRSRIADRTNNESRLQGCGMLLVAVPGRIWGRLWRLKEASRTGSSPHLRNSVVRSCAVETYCGLRLWMMRRFPSGSATVAIQHTGLSIGSKMNFTPAVRSLPT
jgi:hypothetical protein